VVAVSAAAAVPTSSEVSLTVLVAGTTSIVDGATCIVVVGGARHLASPQGGARCLLDGSLLHEPPEVPVHLPSLRAIGLEDRSENHRRSGDVLAGAGEDRDVITVATSARGFARDAELGGLALKLSPFNL
jgi:hypothetical protein